MSDASPTPRAGYQPPHPIAVPPLYAWPPNPIATLRWILRGLLFPWGLFFIGLAFLSWHFFTPALKQMASFELGWLVQIWIRNAVLLTFVAGSLHGWLYIRKNQNQEYKFNPRWQTTHSRKFLWRNQVKDNMFWSLVSGCTIWTLYEAITFWLYANGFVAIITWEEAPLYLSLMLISVFFWSTLHFYLNHRLLHWPPLYRAAHELHHRNTNPGPWSGISMHPLEHLIYFTVFCLWWIVPVHPVVILLTGFFQGISPAISHSGFDQVVLGNKRVTAGDLFHQLHHKYFEVNYGNTPTPLDKLFGSWHDGQPETLALLKAQRRGIHQE